VEDRRAERGTICLGKGTILDVEYQKKDARKNYEEEETDPRPGTYRLTNSVGKPISHWIGKTSKAENRIKTGKKMVSRKKDRDA